MAKATAAAATAEKLSTLSAMKTKSMAIHWKKKPLWHLNIQIKCENTQTDPNSKSDCLKQLK